MQCGPTPTHNHSECAGAWSAVASVYISAPGEAAVVMERAAEKYRILQLAFHRSDLSDRFRGERHAAEKGRVSHRWECSQAAKEVLVGEDCLDHW